MALEPQWTAKELQSLGNAVLALEELLQEWEAEHDLKVTDLMLNLGSGAKGVRPVGLVSLRGVAETELQFEALEASITIA
jgi:hypothetical protein